MKPLIIIVCLVFSLCACAMGGKPIPQRADTDKLYRACSVEEVPQNRVGKLCNHTCVKRQKDKCEEWKLNIKDMTKEEDFKFFEAGKFIFIREDLVL